MHSSRAVAKVLSLADLRDRRALARRQGRTVVQCHGCFDIVHPGHIRHLRQARSAGDILLVTITGDSAYTKRGGAPLIPEELRAEALAELDCVDWVHIDQHSTARDLLEAVRPDVYVKGREYETNKDERFQSERATVERHGGRVVFSSGDVVFSSTALIASMERSIDPYHARLGQLCDDPDLRPDRLGALLGEFRGRRILVVGETILDTYILCDQPEVASESPVMTLRPLERRQFDGGAAIIARHMAAMGGRPILLSGMPDSPQSEAVRRRLTSEGVEVHCVETDTPLAEKQRFLVGAQKVMKLNQLEPVMLDAARQDRFVRLAEESAHECEGAIIADFGNGLLSGPMVEQLCAALRPRVGVLAGDVSGRRAGLLRFRDLDLLCPSESEVREAYRDFDQSIPAVAWRLLEETRSRAAMITLGADGLIAFDRRSEPVDESDPVAKRLRGAHVPALCGQALDPLGCGDALLAAATMALCAGGTLVSAAFLGSVAAAAQAQRLGNLPVSVTDLRQGCARVHGSRLAFAPADTPVRPAIAVR
ncbi:MAG: PfkB family carbohydrate kinase [Phycisphaerales bacterium]